VIVFWRGLSLGFFFSWLFVGVAVAVTIPGFDGAP
jgi:hypothetical protein